MPDVEHVTLPLRAPKTWRESYTLKGMNCGDGTYEFMAFCELCQHISYGKQAPYAVDEHFYHASSEHNYVFNEGTRFNVEDKELQDLIQGAQEHDLPLVGYENHTKCIKVMKSKVDGTKFVACAIHKGNEYRPKIWMGMA